MNCPQCGGRLEVAFVDKYAGILYECSDCGAKSDHTEAIEDGPEAERLREKREADIGEAQYQAWLARVRFDPKNVPDEVAK